ncbi:MAG: FtsK/SpoIIIE domain-containing protein [Ferrimicrobium sp.]
MNSSSLFTGIYEIVAPRVRNFTHRYWPQVLIAFAVYELFVHTGLVGLGLLALAAFVLWKNHRSRAWLRAYFSDRTLKSKVRAAVEAVLPDTPPQIVAVEKADTYVRITLRLQPGSSVDQLETAREALAVHLRMGQVRISRSQADASLVVLTCVKGAPLSNRVLTWPGELSATSVFDPIEVGIDESGEPLYVNLNQNNLIVAGEPGAGKSVFLSRLLCDIARDPAVQLFIFDGKPPELSGWTGRAQGHVGTDIEFGLQQLDRIADIMAERYNQLAELHLKRVTPTSGMSLVLVVVDELPYYIASGKEGTLFAKKLRDVIARGRAAGIVCILTAQKPTSDTIPTNIRDLISLRVTFRCSTREASDIVLGSGWGSEGYSANTISLRDRGVGYFLGEAGLPQLFRSYYVPPEVEEAIQDEVTK